MTQAELAYAVDLTPHYIAPLETALKLPTLRSLLLIASELDTTVGELLTTPNSERWPEQLARIVSGLPKEARPLCEKVVLALADEVTSALTQSGRHAKAYTSP